MLFHIPRKAKPAKICLSCQINVLLVLLKNLHYQNSKNGQYEVFNYIHYNPTPNKAAILQSHNTHSCI